MLSQKYICSVFLKNLHASMDSFSARKIIVVVFIQDILKNPIYYTRKESKPKGQSEQVTFQLLFENVQRWGIADLRGKHVLRVGAAASVPWRTPCLRWGVEEKKVQQVLWSKGIKEFVGEEQDFIGNMGLYQEPVEVHKDRG